MSKPHVAILGGGPAGCGAAHQLRRNDIARVTLIERSMRVGGNAGSFEAAGQFLDYGSHRLHSACDAEILHDLQSMLGSDLAHRERRGRIRLRGKWLHFPLQMPDVLLRLDRAFALGIVRDMIARQLFGKPEEGETFAAVLNAKLGNTLCEQFYYPYARKLWGHEPSELSGIQAKKRVSAGSVTDILKRLIKPPGEGKFYYPRKGFGQITEAYAAESQKLGADYLTGWTANRISRPDHDTGRFCIELTNRDGQVRSVEADHVWSTIPLTILCRMMSPAPPPEVVQASQSIDYRSMILVYLTLPVQRFTGTDAHYFPELNIRMTRLSEPKNYFDADGPKGMTTLCAEVPCRHGDEVWNMTDEALGKLILDDMRVAELPMHEPVTVFTRRLRQAYPIYTIGYEYALETMDSWLAQVPDLLVFGRQGLFAHDNTHHALYMAYSAARCLQENGSFDHARWGEYRKVFATHVVED